MVEDTLEEQDRLLTPLRVVVQGTCRFLASHPPGHEGPAPGSPCAIELAGQGEWVADFWPTPAVTSHAYATMPAEVALEHLDALGGMLTAPITKFIDVTMVRVILDTSARAWWLLDPALDVRERHRRVLNERPYSTTEALKTMRTLGMSTDATMGRMAMVVEYARGHGFDVREHTVRTCQHCAAETEVRHAHPFLAPNRPNAYELLSKMTDPALMPFVGAVYRQSSAVMHGVGHGVASRMELGEELEPGVYQAEPRSRTLTEVAGYVGLATDAFITATDRRLDFLGRNDETWRSWKIHLHRTIRPFLGNDCDTTAPPAALQPGHCNCSTARQRALRSTACSANPPARPSMSATAIPPDAEPIDPAPSSLRTGVSASSEKIRSCTLKADSSAAINSSMACSL